MLLVVVVGWDALVEEAAEALLVGVKGVSTLTGNAADGAGSSTRSALVDLQVTSLLQRLDLDAQIAASGVGNLAEVHETSTLETVEGNHDFQSQLVVEQGIDNGELEWTHILLLFTTDYTDFTDFVHF